MPTFIPLSQTQAGPLQLVNPGDVLFVANGVVLGSTNDVGVIADQGNTTVLLHGTIAGQSGGLNLSLNGGNNRLVVGETGHLQGFDGPALVLERFNSTVQNDGVITSLNSDGINVLTVSQGGQSRITNTGLIEGARSGIFSGFDGNETLVVTNSGVIRGGETSYLDLSDNPRIDLVTNTGTMIGNALLGSGNDVYEGRTGTLLGELYGGTGADALYTGSGADEVFGGAGEDTLNGGAGADSMTGGLGDDIFFVDTSGDRINEISGEGTTDRVAAVVSFALAADDDIELLTTTSSGGTAAINLTGNAVAQQITGNAGANVLSDGGGAGADTLTGLGGNDTYIIRNAATTIVEGAGQGTADRVAAGVSFTLAADDNIEVMSTLSAAATTTINLTGNALRQTISGNAGANRLDGKGGNDVLTGGAGADSFQFSTALAGNIDTITDFNVAADTIRLQDAVFTGLSLGTLTAAAFRLNDTGQAGDASDRIIYEADTGNLYFDADGTGATARVQFAVLDTGLGLTASDFLVF